MTVPVPGSLTYTYLEDGVSTVFSYPVRFLEATELLVIREDAAGQQSTLVYDVDYTVSGAGNPSGGSITRTAVTNGGKIIITRNTDSKQLVDLKDAQRNPAEAVELQLDRLAMAGQDMARDIGRSWKAGYGAEGKRIDAVPPGHFHMTDDDGNMVDGGRAWPLPSPAPYQLLAWNSNGTAVENRAIAGDGGMLQPVYDPEGRAAAVMFKDNPDAIGILSMEAPANLKRLVGTPVNGGWLSSGGNMISFEPKLSTPVTGQDHQLTAALFAATTRTDNEAEEQTVCIHTMIETGYRTAWAQSTSYALGDNVQSGVNSVYRCVQAGVSASSGSGPTGTGASISDGTCVWQWINDAAIASKVGLYVETTAILGGGAIWGAAFNTHMANGYNGSRASNVEFDFVNNGDLDAALGGPNYYNLYIASGGAKLNTAVVEILSNSADAPKNMWGLHVGGGMTREAIGIDAVAPYGLRLGGLGSSQYATAAIRDQSTSGRALQTIGTYATATWDDQSHSPAFVNAGGTHTNYWQRFSGSAPIGLDLSAGTYSTKQIKGIGWDVSPTGVISALGLTLAGSAAYGITVPSTSGYTSAVVRDQSSSGRFAQIQGSYTQATIDDTSNSPAFINSGGTHSLAWLRGYATAPRGIDLRNGTFATAQIDGSGWQVKPNGDVSTHGLIITGGAAPAAATGQVSIGSTAGAGASMPATYDGYIPVNVGGAAYKIPYLA